MGQPIVKGSRYPTAPNAWKGGIRRYSDVKNGLPAAVPQHGEASYVITCEFMVNYVPAGWKLGAISGKVTYFIVPWCTAEQGQVRVNYYIATRHKMEYVISPDKLDEFIQNSESYYIKAVELPQPVNSSVPYLSGQRLPIAPDPWDEGIVPYQAANAHLPHTSNADVFMRLDFPVIGPDNTLKRYKILLAAQYVNMPEPAVKYYIGYDPQLHLNLFAISPDQIDNFARNFWQYYKIAGAFIGMEKEFQAQSLAAEYYAFNLEWGKAFRALGRAWVDAVQDPEWWWFYFAIPTVGWYTSLASRPAAGWQNKIRGKPDTAVVAHAARETHAAETYAVRNDVKEVYLGEEAKTTFKSPKSEKFPDVVAKKQGSYGLGEGKGTDMQKVTEQFKAAGKRLDGPVSEQIVVVEKLTNQTMPGGKTISSPGPGWGVDAQGYLIDMRGPAPWSKTLVNGKPIKVIVKP